MQFHTSSWCRTPATTYRTIDDLVRQRLVIRVGINDALAGTTEQPPMQQDRT